MFAPRSRFQPGALSWRLLAGFLLLAMILGAILVADVANSRRVYETSGAVEHSDEVKIALRQILATLVDAETGQRGFVITGKTEYLEPYDRAIAEFSQNMARVRSMLHDHAAQQTDLERLSSLSETKLGELAEVIKQRRVSGLVAAQSVVMTNLGKRTMDEVRAVIARMDAREDEILIVNVDQARQSYRTALVTSYLMAGLALAFLWYLFAAVRKTALEKVRATASAERFRVTLESIGDAVIATDDFGCVSLMNPVAESLTGWTAADASGRPLREIFIVAANGDNRFLISRDGREVPVDDKAAPIRMADGQSTVGAVLVFRDVSERRRAEEERSLTAEKLAEQARLLDLTQDAILVRDRDGRIVYWNRGAQELYGWTAAEATGKHTRELLETEFPQPLDEIMTAAYGDGRWSGDLIHKRRDGLRVYVSSRWNVDRDAEGYPKTILQINTDITARKHLEEAESVARSEVDRANRMKDELVAVLSHELRTPLTSILGWAAVLNSKELSTEKFQQATQAIQRGARAGVKLVESLLDSTRIALGNLNIEKEPLDLCSVVKAAVDMVRPAADAKGITIDVQMPTAAVLIDGDAARLQQVVWNLLTNAVKFTPQAGRVDVVLGKEESQAKIQIADNGQGIRPDFLPHVFERFTHERGNHGAQVGLGLGLAIVKEIVQAHGGAIHAFSPGEGKGATFVATLPSSAGRQIHPSCADQDG